MTEDDKLIETYYAVRKGAFGFLERIELKQTVDPARWNGFSLEIDLRSGTERSQPTLQLGFKGVHEFRMGEITGLVRYMIEIACIRHSQMEGRTFRVTESEYDAISFVCDSFEITHCGETRSGETASGPTVSGETGSGPVLAK